MASKSAEKQMEEVKKRVRSVLLSQIGGVPLAQFDRDYRALLGRHFPYGDLGFADLRSCLESMPDAVRFEYVDSLKKWMLFGIADSHSFMSSPAIKAQFTPDKPVDKSKKTRKKTSSPRKMPDSEETSQRCKAPRQGATATRRSGLMPNLKGLYGVCLQKLPPKQEEAVKELFGQVASFQETSRGGSHFFLRYQSREAAEEVIARFNNYQLGPTVLKVFPAREKKERRETQQQARQQDSKGSSNSDGGQGASRPNGRVRAQRTRGGKGDKRKSKSEAETPDRARAGQEEERRRAAGAGEASPTQAPAAEEWDADWDSDDDGGDDGKDGEDLPSLLLLPPPLLKTVPLAIDCRPPLQNGLDAVPTVGRSTEPVPPVPHPDSISDISKRTVPKPRLPSILDLADRFKGTKM